MRFKKCFVMRGHGDHAIDAFKDVSNLAFPFCFFNGGLFLSADEVVTPTLLANYWRANRAHVFGQEQIRQIHVGVHNIDVV